MSDGTVTRPFARSPLGILAADIERHGWLVSSHLCSRPNTISDASPLAKVRIRVHPSATVPELATVAPGMARRTSDALVVGIAPGEWLVFGGPGMANILVTTWSKLVGSPGCAAVDLTHARAAMRLTGPLGPAVLSRLCALDVASMPDGTSAGTLVAGVVTGIIRDDAPNGPSYLLHCDRSYGQSLASAILGAGRDHGLEADGDQGARALDLGRTEGRRRVIEPNATDQ